MKTRDGETPGYVVTQQFYYNVEKEEWTSRDQATIFSDDNDAMNAMYRTPRYWDNPLPDGVCIRREGGTDPRPVWERIDGSWQQRWLSGARDEGWQEEARRALAKIYTDEAIEIILDWFDYVKGRKERELVGDAVVDALGSIWDSMDTFDFYSSWMIRLFLYAPAILKEASANQDISQWLAK